MATSTSRVQTPPLAAAWRSSHKMAAAATMAPSQAAGSRGPDVAELLGKHCGGGLAVNVRQLLLCIGASSVAGASMARRRPATIRPAAGV